VCEPKSRVKGCLISEIDKDAPFSWTPEPSTGGYTRVQIYSDSGTAVGLSSPTREDPGDDRRLFRGAAKVPSGIHVNPIEI